MFWDKSQIMPNWVGLILGQIPHCMEQNSSQIPGGISGFGIEWNIILTQNHLSFKRHDKEDDQNIQPLKVQVTLMFCHPEPRARLFKAGLR